VAACAFHLMSQPIEGFLGGIDRPLARSASMAARRSAPVTGTPFFGREPIELAAVDEECAFVVEEEVRVQAA